MVCCVQVTGLVEFLIENQGELFGEEVAGPAGASAAESPAPGLEAEPSEVCQVQKQWDSKSLPQSGGGAAAVGTSKVTHQPAALQKGRVRLMQVGQGTLCADPPRTGSAELSKASQGICLSELLAASSLPHLHRRCLQSLQKANTWRALPRKEGRSSWL